MNSSISTEPSTQQKRTVKYVYDFAEGSKEMKDLLGGKGANLAEMTNLRLPVPPGLTITTEACRAYLDKGREPDGLADEVGEHLAALESVMGKKLGQSDNPLLVSVRSGAKFSMPGMVETVLNIGLNDDSVSGLASQSGDDRFAFDSYRRLIQMSGRDKRIARRRGRHGRVRLDSVTAVKWARSGESVILVQRETNPDDLDGMIAAAGILTSRGGKTSHAAVVARGMGKTAVCGAEWLDVDPEGRKFLAPNYIEVLEGDVISVDGTSGQVFLGEVPVVASPVMRYFEGEQTDVADDLVQTVHRVMSHAEGAQRMFVRANADNAADAQRARRFGAQGIGLCRTEHMFLGERRYLVERLILADTSDERDKELTELLPMQREDFVGILGAMDGLPVTIRLLDPPLHEFLPDITELSVRVAAAEARGEEREGDLRMLQAVHKLHEQDRMLGLRGVRLGVVIPGLVEMQSRAILEAAAERVGAGGDPHVEIMVPLVANVREFETVKRNIIQVAREVRAETGVHLKFLSGTMIELPRAALTADAIAEAAEFFSFGTNDLTRTAWGFSRDDVKAAFFSAYLELGIFGVSPFESIDIDGVGELVRVAAEKGRSRRPHLKLGVCGEHGGDPDSVHFFHEVGLDYVSCSPFRIPVPRLEAARARNIEPRPVLQRSPPREKVNIAMRLPPPDRNALDSYQAEIYDAIAATHEGRVRGPFAIWMAVPPIAAAASALGDSLRVTGRLNPKIFEISVLLCAKFWNAEYPYAVHERLARAVGVSDSVLRVISTGVWQPTPDLTGSEAVAWDVVVALLNRAPIPDELYASAVATLGSESLIELVTTVGFYSTASLVANAFDIAAPAG